MTRLRWLSFWFALAVASLASCTIPHKAKPMCCRMCHKGKPCGDYCIPENERCEEAPGCACACGREREPDDPDSD